MKQLVFFFTFFITLNLSAQVTILVEQLPKNTPKNTAVFISGNFEDWSGGKKQYQLDKKDEGYFITLPKTEEPLQFKFTQGSWESVECANNGHPIDNRLYKFKKTADTLKLKIAGWDNLFTKENVSTATKNVSLLNEGFYIPQLDRNRRVWLYLPPNYETSNKSYPVIYMHDGQNLFDKSTSGFGEWEVDETLNKLAKTKNLEFIVVAVDHGDDKRLDEYSPWKNTKFGGGEGDDYLEFLVSTLKPYIDSNYKTLTDKNNTAIFGSSMGGLISYYAALKYPEVFGKVGVYSPAFWFAPEVGAFTESNGNILDTQMYFLAGGNEGGNTAFEEINQTVSDMNRMSETLKSNGFPKENIHLKVVPKGEHNEKLWRNSFEETIRWLFKDCIKTREFVSAKVIDNILSISVSDGNYLMRFYTPQIAETSFFPKGEIQNKKSHAVILTDNNSATEYQETDKKITFKTTDLSIEVTKNPFHISYWNKGKEVISEKKGYQKTATYETIQFNLKEDEFLYGGGARALGMNRRGNRLELYNKAHYGYETHSELMNYTMPIVLSSDKYLLHFDNAPIGFLDLDSHEDNTLTYETISGRKTYQVVVGETWLKLIDNYTNLTGKQPMLPSWALGNFSSRFGYHSQVEVEKTIDKFIAEDIPVDAVILDLYWFGKDIKGTMGNLAWAKDSFPKPKQMIKTLRDKNVETILVTEPFILTTSKRWQEAVNADILAKDTIGNPFTYDFYFGNTGLIDIYSEHGSMWFKDIYRGLAAQGITGFWGDLGEPEVHPSNLIHAIGTANEVHNIYGHDWAKLVYQAQKEVNPNKRPFTLMRAGYSGSQRYGLVPWSGDVNRTWGGLQSQPEIAIQMGMQGLAYMHSDLGGFAGANLDDELYERWLQYGVFQPIYRPHAQEEVASEPVFKSEKTKNLARKAIKLRYTFLPYNYHLMFENNQSGAPLMRPLFFEEPNNLKLFNYSETYLWGADILVAPILKPGVSEKSVYFPKASNWYDFYTDEKIAGGQTKTVQTKENSIPTYVRGGAFIPLANGLKTTKDYTGNVFTLHYYYDETVEESTRQLYQDGGVLADAFETGNYELLHFESELKRRGFEIELEAKLGTNYIAPVKTITLIIHNIYKKPKRVKIDNKKMESHWDSEKQTLTIPISWNTANELEITIKH